MSVALQDHIRPWSPFIGRIGRVMYRFDGARLKLVFLHAGYESARIGRGKKVGRFAGKTL